MSSQFRSKVARAMPEGRKALRRSGFIDQQEVASGFRAPGQLLWKLGREVNALGDSPIPDDVDYRPWLIEALNAATTAWHLCDWTVHYFQECTRGPFRSEFAENWLLNIQKHARKKSSDPALSGMQAFSIEHCPEMEICQVLATRIKHRHSKRLATREATLTIDYRWEIGPDGVQRSLGFDAIIVDGDYYYVAFELLSVVHAWWRQYLEGLQIVGGNYIDDLTSRHGTKPAPSSPQ